MLATRLPIDLPAMMTGPWTQSDSMAEQYTGIGFFAFGDGFLETDILRDAI
ncbi:hypothetical protein LJR098_005750 [Rhizobium sp. LjRoot98]